MARIGPGFRFHPTGEELVVFYLKRKITRNLSRHDHIVVVDVYKLEPWDLPSMSKLKTKDLEWYFFSVLDHNLVGILPNRVIQPIAKHSKDPVECLALSHDRKLLGSIAHD
ncbi:hypothetical protein Fmac_028405 [Flemingia macrophylla]|uniref:NAC domain-containing protein n=1 Tax=Flemingia macrophylla TaxID=520843 RepID=A0ABD1L7E9_9FABA